MYIVQEGLGMKHIFFFLNTHVWVAVLFDILIMSTCLSIGPGFFTTQQSLKNMNLIISYFYSNFISHKYFFVWQLREMRFDPPKMY